MRPGAVGLLTLCTFGLYSILSQRRDVATIINFLHTNWVSDNTESLVSSKDDEESDIIPPDLVPTQEHREKRVKPFRTYRKERPRNSARRQKRKRKGKIIYFLHIHKSGGTAICEAVMAAGLSVNYPENCNVQDDQRCCGGDDTLQAQTLFAQATNFDFVANERDMYEAMDPDSYHYVLTLRNSRERYISHWRHVWRAGSKTNFRYWCNRQPDNWNTRKICGTRCSDVPKFQISKEDWAYTVERLKLFHHILFLERFTESYKKFANDLNLTVTKLEENSAADRPKSPPKSDWDPLTSALDDALYEIAQRIDAGGTPVTALTPERQQVLEQYFISGKEQGCENPCCASQCSQYR